MINIYVGNLPYDVESDELRETFEEFGDVDSAEIIIDRRTRRSRGYGFVEMTDSEAGIRAIDSLNGADYRGRELRVDESQPRTEKPKHHQTNRRPTQRRHRESRAKQQTGSGGLIGFVKRLFN